MNGIKPDPNVFLRVNYHAVFELLFVKKRKTKNNIAPVVSKIRMLAEILSSTLLSSCQL